MRWSWREKPRKELRGRSDGEDGARAQGLKRMGSREEGGRERGSAASGGVECGGGVGRQA